MSNLTKLINTEIRLLKGERRAIDSKLKGLEKARAALAPAKILGRKQPKRKRTAARKASNLNKVDKGLAKTITTLLKQQTATPDYLGLKATDIVEKLQARGHIFTAKFPSRSVSGLLTILHKKGKVARTPLGSPRVYHYRAPAANSIPASSVPSEVPMAASKSQQRRLEHQTEGGEGDGLET